MARKETMAERKYCKMKKISIQNIVQLSSWTQLLVTNSLAVQQKRSNETVEFGRRNLPIDPCGNFIRLTPILHWTSKVHSSRWTRGSFQQKNTVSNNNKKDSFGCSFCFLKSATVSCSKLKKNFLL